MSRTISWLFVALVRFSVTLRPQCMTTVRLVTAKRSGSVWLMRRFHTGLTGVDRTGKTHPLPLKPHSEYTRAARTCAILPDGIRSAVRDPP